MSGSVTKGFSFRTILNAVAILDSARFESLSVNSVSTEPSICSLDNVQFDRAVKRLNVLKGDQLGEAYPASF